MSRCTDYDRLRNAAQAEVEITLLKLAVPLRARAQEVPVTFQPRPNHAQMDDGIEPDTLGVFTGPEFADVELALSPVPSQIILFLENIWSLADGREQLYRDEVRITFLHELGHYLGLDENGLIERGLE